MFRNRLGVALGLVFLSFSPGARTQAGATAQSIEHLQLELKLHPDDYKAYAALGSAYLQKGRESGDAADLELAKTALGKSLELRSMDPFAAFTLTQMAAAYMAEHRFHDAYEWGKRALAVSAGDPSPWAIVGDALADVGQYGQAAAAYQRLVKTNGSSDEARSIEYQRLSRTSYLGFIAGNTAEAMEQTRKALQIAIDLRMPAENIAWSQSQLGEESFQQGNMNQASSSFEAALAVYPGYYRALAGLAKVRAAQGNLGASEELYEKAIAAVPFPEYAAALGDLYLSEGKRAMAQKEYDLVEFIGHLGEINAEIHNRDLAMFYADHGLKLEQAVALAKKELEVRQDVYTWDALAWALYKHGDLPEAEAATKHSLLQGTRDAQILFHAGMIYQRSGDLKQAQESLSAALTLNPHFHPIHSEEARKTLQELNAANTARLSMEKPRAQQ